MKPKSSMIFLLLIITFSVIFSMYSFFKKESFTGTSLGRGYGIEGIGADVDYSSNMNINRFNANTEYSNTVNLAATKPKTTREFNSDDEPLYYSLPKQL